MGEGYRSLLFEFLERVLVLWIWMLLKLVFYISLWQYHIFLFWRGLCIFAVTYKQNEREKIRTSLSFDCNSVSWHLRPFWWFMVVVTLTHVYAILIRWLGDPDDRLPRPDGVLPFPVCHSMTSQSGCQDTLSLVWTGMTWCVWGVTEPTSESCQSPSPPRRPGCKGSSPCAKEAWAMPLQSRNSYHVDFSKGMHHTVV